jgi:FMN-dependent NADH-azoreductase
MSKVLVINSSVTGEASVSHRLVDEVVAGLRAADAGVEVVERDLSQAPVPHLSGETLAGFGGAETPAAVAARALSDELVAELKAADVLVIGAPMYNFGIPSTLKAWFDHVLRAGVTFRYTETGPVGLVGAKTAIVVSARGGVFAPEAAEDHQERHLRTLLGFIGLNDVRFVRAEGLALGEQPRAQALAAAQQQVLTLKAELASAA